MPTIVITGASQGIGAAIAREMSTVSGARIALVSRNTVLLGEVAELCRSNGAEAIVQICDVTDADAVHQMGEAITRQWGPPDMLVNNAGMFTPGSVLETDPEVFRRQVDVNLTSAFLVSKSFLPGMIERKSGHLFFTASVASIRAYAGGAAYCAAKHGLLGLARVIREETREAGIRVTSLLPGATYTPSWEGSDLPESRFMPAEDIARTVHDIYRLSDRTVVEEILLRPQLGDI